MAVQGEGLRASSWMALAWRGERERGHLWCCDVVMGKARRWWAPSCGSNSGGMQERGVLLNTTETSLPLWNACRAGQHRLPGLSFFVSIHKDI